MSYLKFKTGINKCHLKSLIIFLFIIVFFSCNNQKISIDSVKEFSDYLSFSNEKYNINFKLDTFYFRSENTFGASWGANKGYAFISKNDTLKISIYFTQFVQNERPLDEKKKMKESHAAKMYNNYYCNLKDYYEMNYFFKGDFSSCIGGQSEVLAFHGIKNDYIRNYCLEITILSTGKSITKEREENFKQIVQTIKIDLVPK